MQNEISYTRPLQVSQYHGKHVLFMYFCLCAIFGNYLQLKYFAKSLICAIK